MGNGIATYSTLGTNGRMCNAYFQAAFTISYAIDNGKDFIFPLWEYSKWMQKELPIGTLADAQQIAVPFHYESIKPYYGNVDFRYAHAQSEKYFKHNWKSIKPYLTIKDEYRDFIIKKHSEIIKQNTCSIHLRLGDYTLPINQDYHGIMPISYYQKAIRKIYGKDNPSDVLFVIFSDDISKCKEMFELPNMVFIEGEETVIPKWKDNNGLPMGNGDLLDLFFMSYCRNNIICNSSFSWWGAWLNENPIKKVVSPINWFNKAPMISKDIYAENWIVV